VRVARAKTLKRTRQLAVQAFRERLTGSWKLFRKEELPPDKAPTPIRNDVPPNEEFQQASQAKAAKKAELRKQRYLNQIKLSKIK
jgi:hypothetical protein